MGIVKTNQKYSEVLFMLLEMHCNKIFLMCCFSLLLEVVNFWSTRRYQLEQGFPTWGTCTPGGTFAYPKGYI